MKVPPFLSLYISFFCYSTYQYSTRTTFSLGKGLRKNPFLFKKDSVEFVYWCGCCIFIRTNYYDIMKKVLNKEEFKDIIKEMVSESIDEISRNEKHRRNKSVEGLMTNPDTSNIKTLAVFTAENPDSTPTPKDNKRYNNSLAKDLKMGHYVVIPSKGKFGSVENSFAVLNISLETVMAYCGKYQQTSFIFSINDNGKLVNEYWAKQNESLPYDKHTNPYVKKDTESSVIRMDDANDYYTQIGDFKFTIPFPIFNENISRIIQGKHFSTKEKLLEHSMRNGQNAYLWRGAIYKGLL